MSNTTIGGSATIKIGENPITITTDDLNASPVVFTLPASTPITIKMVDLITFLTTDLKIPSFTLPGPLQSSSLSITTLQFSSAGLFNLAATFELGDGGWAIIPGLPALTLQKVTLTVVYSNSPYIQSLTPTSGAVGATVTITGNDLAPGGAAPTVNFGKTLATLSATPAPTQNSITVTVPTGATTGDVTVTNTDGTSNGVTFTVST